MKPSYVCMYVCLKIYRTFQLACQSFVYFMSRLYSAEVWIGNILNISYNEIGNKLIE